MSKARDLANAGTALTSVDATELGYLDGVTSAVQTQIDSKLATATASSTYQAIVSGVNDTEIGYLDGVTSAIQTQIDSKIGSASAINPTIVDAKGDVIAATAADTVARLAVGANNTVLTADSAEATGLKWAAPSSGSWTLITQQNPSNANSVNFTSIPQTYKHIMLEWVGAYQTSAVQSYNVRINNDSGSNYSMNAFLINGGTVTPQIQESGTDISASNFAGSNLSLFGYDVRDTDYGKASKGKLIIFNYTDTARYKHSEWQAYYNITSEGSRNHQGQGVWKSLSAITSIDIVRVAGGNASLSTNTYGYIRLWGMS